MIEQYSNLSHVETKANPPEEDTEDINELGYEFCEESLILLVRIGLLEIPRFR